MTIFGLHMTQRKNKCHDVIKKQIILKIVRRKGGMRIRSDLQLNDGTLKNRTFFVKNQYRKN